MSFKILFFVVLLLLCFAAAEAPKLACALNHSDKIIELKYPVVTHKLNIYRKAFHFLSSEIVKKKKNINDLRSKIKIVKADIKLLKDKINADNLVSRSLIRRIFIIQRDKDTLKLTSIGGNIDYFIAFRQLKTILYGERSALDRLMARKDRFLKMKIYFKEEKADLKKAVESLKTSRYKLNKLIKNIQAYIKIIKIRYMNSIRDKKNRLLKKKVIKLMHKINNKPKKPKNRDIKFIILR